MPGGVFPSTALLRLKNMMLLVFGDVSRQTIIDVAFGVEKGYDVVLIVFGREHRSMTQRNPLK